MRGNVDYDGQQKKLDVSDTFSANIRCADFNIGSPGRRGKPGRALVDGTDVLSINYRKDWPKGVKIDGDLHVTGQITSSGLNIVMGYQTQTQTITTRNAWTALPDCKVTITTRGGKVLIQANLDAQAIGGDSWGVFTIYRGTTNLKPNKTGLASIHGRHEQNSSVHLHWLDTPPAGTHQYQVYVQRRGNHHINLSEIAPSSIIVQEMI